MKKHLLTIAALAFAVFSHANVIIDETFNYNVDTLGAAPEWTSTGYWTEGANRALLATPLEYTQNDKEYALSGVGKAVKNVYAKGSNYIAYKQIEEISSGVVYLSYLYKADGDQSQSQSEVIGLSDAKNQSAVKAWAGKQSSGTKNPFRLGITRVSTTGGDIQWCDDSTIPTNTVILVVLKYDFTNQTASLFINPELGTTVEPTANISDSEKGIAKSSLGYIIFKHNGNSVANFTVSGLRVSTTWAEAVAKKGELTTLDAPIVGEASQIGADNFTANWTAVESATGYRVNVYYGENVIAEKVVNGQEETSVVVNNVPVATTMSYKVIALGDGIDYNNSPESSASESFTTTSDPIESIELIPSDDIWKGTSLYTNSYTSASIFGYDFANAYFHASNKSGYTARIVLSATTGVITLPAVKSASQIKVYAHAGTDQKAIKVEQYNSSTDEWEQIGDASYPLSKDNITEVSVTPKSGVAKLRVANADGSSKYIWKIETIPAPVNPTAIDQVNAGAKARKVMVNGQMLIERNGEYFNMTGTKVL
ncbi:MAG: hypothetical protein IJ814_08500 [Paludibacteraceae bacterium]|nr:hypothetical protein [Paludibacteraceae bacterium]